MAKKLDLTGQRFGRLVVIERSDRLSGGRRRYWTCQCDCGETKDIYSSSLIQGLTKSCGCYNSQVLSERSKTHGMSKTREYKTWNSLRLRRKDLGTKTSYEYSRMGIEIQDKILESFDVFYSDIGPIPEDMEKPTIDRVDTTKGYEIGNIQWLDARYQNMNMVKSVRNTSGKVGVSVEHQERDDGSFYKRYRAHWMDYPTSKLRSKTFSVDKLGEELAHFAACEYRDLMIEKQNLKGAKYTKYHGMDSVTRNLDLY